MDANVHFYEHFKAGESTAKLLPFLPSKIALLVFTTNQPPTKWVQKPYTEKMNAKARKAWQRHACNVRYNCVAYVCMEAVRDYFLLVLSAKPFNFGYSFNTKTAALYNFEDSVSNNPSVERKKWSNIFNGIDVCA